MMLAAVNAVVVRKKVRRVIFMPVNDPFSACPSKEILPIRGVTANCGGERPEKMFGQLESGLAFLGGTYGSLSQIRETPMAGFRFPDVRRRFPRLGL
jgi:hypothetical protein